MLALFPQTQETRHSKPEGWVLVHSGQKDTSDRTAWIYG